MLWIGPLLVGYQSSSSLAVSVNRKIAHRLHVLRGLTYSLFNVMFLLFPSYFYSSNQNHTIFDLKATVRAIRKKSEPYSAWKNIFCGFFKVLGKKFSKCPLKIPTLTVYFWISLNAPLDLEYLLCSLEEWGKKVCQLKKENCDVP